MIADTLDYRRIRASTDVDRLNNSIVTLVGCGGGANLGRNLVRSGLGTINLVDFDTVENINICRQEHMFDMIGMLKVEALAAELKRINPQVQVRCIPCDFCSLTDKKIDQLFGDSDAFLFCVDNLPANARGNETALRLGKPAVWSAVYPLGRGGEVCFWHEGQVSCYRDYCGARYRAHESGMIQNNPDESADVLTVQFIDSIAAMVMVGLLTRGADNFYGRLIDQLGDRNFLQIRAHNWTWNGRDIIREQLQIPSDCPAYFSFCTIARSDPDKGQPPCPDCVKYRGRKPLPQG